MSKKKQEKKLFRQFLLRKSSMQGCGIFATITFQICLLRNLLLAVTHRNVNFSKST